MTTSSIASLILGESAAIDQMRALIARLAPTRIPILIQGPTGSGKELVARALHLTSRRSGRCVAFNVGAITETLFEDTLFGHVRGAFSGAVASIPGVLAEADRGTLFLDEIGSLALAGQVKLLRAIETGEFRPIGARDDRRSEFRVIAAANEDLLALVTEGRFRADLLERLRGAIIRVPSLEERREDIPLLAQHFARSVSACAMPGQLTDAAIHSLQERRWPGNVRQLKHIVECAAAIASTPLIGRDDVILVTEILGGDNRGSQIHAAPTCTTPNGSASSMRWSDTSGPSNAWPRRSGSTAPPSRAGCAAWGSAASPPALPDAPMAGHRPVPTPALLLSDR